jgi:hypothetical protein
MVKTEQYLANKVLMESDHEYLRLSSRNYNKKCVIWSAQVIATKSVIMWASIALLRVRTVKYLTRVHMVLLLKKSLSAHPHHHYEAVVL